VGSTLLVGRKSAAGFHKPPVATTVQLEDLILTSVWQPTTFKIRLEKEPEVDRSGQRD
jgi:hypothetical protein